MAEDDDAGETPARDGNVSPDARNAEGRERKPAGSPRRRTPPAPPTNGIEATRRRRRAEHRATPAESVPEEPSEPTAPGKPTTFASGESDPWTVPQSVRDRFVQDGNRFYFPDGAPAFRDLGRKLTTPSENTQVVHSLIQIAQSRRWTEVTVAGSDRFREEAWRQARLAGLSVRGYRPDEAARAQLIRALGRNLPANGERIDSVSAAVPPLAGAGTTTPAENPTREKDREPTERIAGRVLEHGKDAYQHDPNQQPSYFMRLETPEGVREVWGKDIERAVARSLTQPKIGDAVILQRTGRDAVTVRRSERNQAGETTERPLDTFRNRWVIETRDFFEKRAEAAQVVRNEAIQPQQGVRQHPELAGTYLSLKAAEIASRSLTDSTDQRRFVAQVRRVLAQDIERGEPLQPVRVRQRNPRDRGPRLAADVQGR